MTVAIKETSAVLRTIEVSIPQADLKLPFEKKLNIVASNGYFSKKQEHYKKSKIAITKEMSNTTIKDWKLEEIKKNNSKIIDEIINTFKLWN